MKLGVKPLSRKDSGSGLPALGTVQEGGVDAFDADAGTDAGGLLGAADGDPDLTR